MFGKHLGKPSIFYDPSGLACKDNPAAHGIMVIDNKAYLAEWLRRKAFARSPYILEDLKAGEIISQNNVKSIRPCFGMHPRLLSEIIGKRY